MQPFTPASPASPPHAQPHSSANLGPIPLQPSQLYLQWLIGAHTLASILILGLNTGVFPKLAMLVCVCCALINAMNHWRSLTQLEAIYTQDNKIFIKVHALSEPLEAIFYGQQLISDRLSLLTLRRISGETIRLPLFLDCTDTESLRQLRQFICSSALTASPGRTSVLMRKTKNIGTHPDNRNTAIRQHNS